MPPDGRRRPLREAGVPFVPEGYVDLDYDAAGKLVLERVKQVRDPEEMGEQALRLVREGTVRTIDGGELELRVESICVHGDAPNAPEIARAIRAARSRPPESSWRRWRSCARPRLRERR